MDCYVLACRLEEKQLEDELLPYAARAFDAQKPFLHSNVLGPERCQILVWIDRLSYQRVMG